ncbi:MAG: periplasmic heavy metal sensor [Verrucomicrobia bacterium]|nr:periplasmic heavy metal sensor [Verrucomicrobiota bacterium]
MRRSLLIVLAVLAAGAVLFVAAYGLAGRLCARQMARPADDLHWLRLEFQLGEAELARIRPLHEGYLPKCQEFCRQIAVKKHALQQALGTNATVSAEAEQTLSEIAALRAQCQTQMLRHFGEVSRAMPPEQGRRYLAEMQRLTLGFHDQIEASMSGATPAHHGSH